MYLSTFGLKTDKRITTLVKVLKEGSDKIYVDGRLNNENAKSRDDSIKKH